MVPLAGLAVAVAGLSVRPEGFILLVALERQGKDMLAGLVVTNLVSGLPPVAVVVPVRLVSQGHRAVALGLGVLVLLRQSRVRL